MKLKLRAGISVIAQVISTLLSAWKQRFYTLFGDSTVSGRWPNTEETLAKQWRNIEAKVGLQREKNNPSPHFANVITTFCEGHRILKKMGCLVLYVCSVSHC